MYRVNSAFQQRVFPPALLSNPSHCDLFLLLLRTFLVTNLSVAPAGQTQEAQCCVVGACVRSRAGGGGGGATTGSRHHQGRQGGSMLGGGGG
ncbi:hypothetical protein Pcinc_037324 [Petrolisthes cinctipes]|uniref:Uncharacterized protein n=1 Tax=Petrolisthes cinctipes TaxID=88211 RepID=A0AAE1BH47_PETCI|nr:hypothetical protein Pcinc_042623 [Petrolisthes cinctipes]KAK3856347.1 hypothetical protein Pcinc_037324 [Petrolisthes cinctipes]